MRQENRFLRRLNLLTTFVFVVGVVVGFVVVVVVLSVCL